MKEKLQQYALIAEIISAICIVLSLVFVGLQVRQGAEETAANSEAIRAQVRQAMMQAEIDMVQYSGSNNLMTRDSTPENLDQAVAIAIAFQRTRELYWIQHENRLLDDATYLSYRSIFIKNLHDQILWKEQWDDAVANNLLNPGFVAEINAILAAE